MRPIPSLILSSIQAALDIVPSRDISPTKVKRESQIPSRRTVDPSHSQTTNPPLHSLSTPGVANNQVQPIVPSLTRHPHYHYHWKHLANTPLFTTAAKMPTPKTTPKTTKKPAGRSAIADVVAREYTIHLHKRVRLHLN